MSAAFISSLVAAAAAVALVVDARLDLQVSRAWAVYDAGGPPLPPDLVPQAVRADLLGLATFLVAVSCLAIHELRRGYLAGHRRSLWVAVAVAFGARALVSVGFSIWGLVTRNTPILLDDEMALHNGAQQLAGILRAGSGSPDQEWQHLTGYHLDLIALIYTIGPGQFEWVRLLNALTCALLVALTFVVTAATIDRRGATLAAFSVAIWPALVLWGSTGLRDAPTWLMVVIVLWIVSTYSGRPRSVRVLSVVVLLWALQVLYSIRPPVAIALAIAVLFALAVRSLRWALIEGSLALAAAAVLIVVPGLRPAFLDQLTPAEIERRTAAEELTPLVELTPSKQTPKPEADLEPIGSIVRVPVGNPPRLTTGIVADYQSNPVAYVIRLDATAQVIAPPEQVLGPRYGSIGWGTIALRVLKGARLLFLPTTGSAVGPAQVLPIADTLLWDVLVVVDLAVILRARKMSQFPFVVILTWSLVLMLGMATISSSIGTLSRQRSMLILGFIVLATPLLMAALRRVGAGLHASRAAPTASHQTPAGTYT